MSHGGERQDVSTGVCAHERPGQEGKQRLAIVL